MSISTLYRSQAPPARPSGSSSMEMKICEKDGVQSGDSMIVR